MKALLALLAAATVAVSGQEPKTWRNPKDGAVYVFVPPGELPVGAERYQFPKGFWMARTEVTVRQFEQFASETGYRTEAEKANRARTWRTPGYRVRSTRPVVWLSFADAQAYVQWAGVDLPSEAEWLYAAKAGAATRFYWGDQADDRYVWHRENSPDGPQPVGKKAPNAWGLYDMVGNAWEFCRVMTPDGRVCDKASGLLGASWTRCPRYQMRDGRMIDGLEVSLGPVQTKCPAPPERPNDNPWDDDRGIRCVRRP